MEAQKTYFDLLEDLYNYFVEKWGLVDKWKNERAFNYYKEESFKIHLLEFENGETLNPDIFNPFEKFYAMGLEHKPSDKYKPIPQKIRRFCFWTSAPRKYITDITRRELENTDLTVIVSTSQVGEKDHFSLKIKLKDIGLGLYLPVNPSTNQVLEILSKIHEMIKSDKYADTMPHQEVSLHKTTHARKVF